MALPASFGDATKKTNLCHAGLVDRGRIPACDFLMQSYSLARVWSSIL